MTVAAVVADCCDGFSPLSPWKQRGGRVGAVLCLVPDKRAGEIEAEEQSGASSDLSLWGEGRRRALLSHGGSWRGGRERLGPLAGLGPGQRKALLRTPPRTPSRLSRS